MLLQINWRRGGAEDDQMMTVVIVVRHLRMLLVSHESRKGRCFLTRHFWMRRLLILAHLQESYGLMRKLAVCLGFQQPYSMHVTA